MPKNSITLTLPAGTIADSGPPTGWRAYPDDWDSYTADWSSYT
jgi:hypothetical protein